MFLTRLCVAATLVRLSSSTSLLATGGKEVTLRYRLTFDSNWPLGKKRKESTLFDPLTDCDRSLITTTRRHRVRVSPKLLRGP